MVNQADEPLTSYLPGPCGPSTMALKGLTVVFEMERVVRFSHRHQTMMLDLKEIALSKLNMSDTC